MLITRKSMASGIERTLDLPVTEQQMAEYQNGALVQVAFPQLTPDQREFILTGMSPEEWDEMCADIEDDGSDMLEGQKVAPEEAQADLEAYQRHMLSGDFSSCLAIECKYSLAGLPPEQVTFALSALADDEVAF